MSKSVDEKIRCTPEERDAWAAAAREMNVSRAEFLRRAANEAAERVTPWNMVVEPAREFVAGEPQPTPVERKFDAEQIAEINRKFDEVFPPQETRRCPHGRRGPSAGEWCPVCDR